jgi:hypothetical protein
MAASIQQAAVLHLVSLYKQFVPLYVRDTPRSAAIQAASDVTVKWRTYVFLSRR